MKHNIEMNVCQAMKWEGIQTPTLKRASSGTAYLECVKVF